jgi:hypothetical protein
LTDGPSFDATSSIQISQWYLVSFQKIVCQNCLLLHETHIVCFLQH